MQLSDCCSLLLCVGSNYYLMSSHLSWKDSCKHVCEGRFTSNELPPFCVCGNVLISPSFFKGQFFQIYSSWLRGFPRPQHFEYVIPLPAGLHVFDEKSDVNFIDNLFYKNLCCFQDSSPLTFGCLIISMDLFEFFQLGAHQASWRCSFMSLTKFGKYLVIISSYFFIISSSFLQIFFLALSPSLCYPLVGGGVPSLIC